MQAGRLFPDNALRDKSLPQDLFVRVITRLDALPINKDQSSLKSPGNSLQWRKVKSIPH